MASYKVYNKAKSKEDKMKSNKSMPIEDNAVDLSELRRPIHTSLGGLNQVIKVLEHCTTELKDLLTQDCDVLLECRVCRSIYRSPVNYLSHKRTYCNDKYDISKHGYFTQTDINKELLKLRKLREEYWETNKFTERDSEPRRVPLTKDLSAVLEVLTEQNGVSDKRQDLTFQDIPSVSNAVFQNSCREKSSDNMSAQVKEINLMKSQNNAMLKSDGKFSFGSVNVMVEHNDNKKGTTKVTETIKEREVNGENVIQISDDEEEEPRNLRCNLCQVQFLTSKTLKSHYKTQHDDNRLVFPCPDCDDLYSTSWSVYRHLCKVHRKTSTQVKKLRESIQAKAFRLNNPPAYYEKRKNMKIASAQKVTEEERIERENQAWMDNMEGDNEIPRCGGCGRTFERRAALAAHTNTCQPRNRALSKRYAENRKVEMQIRKDNNKSSPSNAIPAKVNDLENITSKECVEKMETVEVCEPTQVNDDILDKNNDQDENDAACYEQIKYPFLETEEENININALKLKVENDIDIETLKCNKCDVIHSDIQALYKHMAEHLGWSRYGCKLCPFKHYMLNMLPIHIQDVHKLKGDNEFYFSTIKVLNPDEAINSVDTSANTSPESRRQSRFSSDSSKLSDVESGNNIRVDSTRKRKHIQRKNEHTPLKDDLESSGKQSEDNSETDDLDDKLFKKRIKIGKSIALSSSRPVRKRSKPKNDDFEYDLSNLLKMEAQGYRDTLPISAPVSTIVKKTTQINNLNKNQKNKTQSFVSNDGKNYSGALMNLTKQAVAKATAQISQVPTMTSQYRIPPIIKLGSKTPNIRIISDLGKDNDSKKDETKILVDKEHTITEIVTTSEIDSLDKTDANKQAENSTESQEQLNNTESNKIIQATIGPSTESNKATFTVPATGTIPIIRDKSELIKNNSQGASTIGNKVLVIKKSNNVSASLAVKGIKLSKAITIGRKPTKPLTFVKYSGQHIVKKMPKGMSITKIVENSVTVPSNINNNSFSESSNNESK